VAATTEDEIKRALLDGSVTYERTPMSRGEAFGYGVWDSLMWIVDPIPERQLYHQEKHA
jgi:hypothetical protein